MAECKACGAEIIFISTPNGRYMPCETKRIPCRINPLGRFTLIMPGGETVKADLLKESNLYGYQSHFVTCPAANKLKSITSDTEVKRCTKQQRKK